MKDKFKIGEIASIKGVPSDTLRYYEKMGLIVPEGREVNNSYRYYGLDQFIALDHIRFYKLLGLSLDSIKSLNDMKEIRGLFDEKRQNLKNEIKRMQYLDEMIETISQEIDLYSSEYKTNPDKIQIKNMATITGVVGVSRTNEDWCKFERSLSEVIKSYPSYSNIGHNHGLLYFFNEGFYQNGTEESLEKIVLPSYSTIIEEEFMEEVYLGTCISILYKGPFNKKGKEEIQRKISKTQEYAADNKLKVRGEIIVKSIISAYIIKDETEHLYEFFIPLQEVSEESAR